LYYDGQEVSRIHGPDETSTFVSLHGCAENQVWAAGENSLLRCSTASCQSEYVPSDAYLNDVWCDASSGVLWTASIDGIRCKEGGDWLTEPVEAHGELLGIWGFSGQDIWVVGTGGSVLHRTGTGWEQPAIPGLGDGDFFSVWGLTAGELWISEFSPGRLIYFDGQTATSVLDLPSWKAHGTVGADTWALCQGGVYRANTVGAEWILDLGDLSGVWVAPTGEVFLTTHAGGILRREPWK
jgi:hypothetical protein